MTAKKKRPDLATLLHTKPSVVTEYLAKHGRKGDKFLAHINRREAAMLKASGGSGTINPKTGIMEFQDEGGFGEPMQDFGFAADVPAEAGPPQYFSGGGGAASVDTQLPPNVPEYAPPSQMSAPQTSFSSMITPAGTEGGLPAYNVPAIPTPTPYRPALTDVGNVPDPYGGAARGSAMEAQPTPTAKTPAQEKPGFLQRNPWAIQAGLGLIGAGAGLQQNKAMQKQVEQYRGQFSGMAQPYQQAGQQLMAQTQAGQLTAPNRQILEAATARANQMVAGGGGVAQQQANQQLSAIAQTLYQNQYQQAYQLLGIGNTIAMKGIEAGMNADQAARAANQQFYMGLANMLSRMQF